MLSLKFIATFLPIGSLCVPIDAPCDSRRYYDTVRKLLNDEAISTLGRLLNPSESPSLSQSIREFNQGYFLFTPNLDDSFTPEDLNGSSG